MNVKSLVFTLVLATAHLFTHAHTMWIEAANKGQLGKAQDIKIFFGEYSDGKPTKTVKWFSDLKEYKLMATAPDGTVSELGKVQDSTFYKASFTPTQEGTYTFWLDHEVKDVFKEMKITYTAGAFVTIKGKKEAATIGKGRYQIKVPNPQKANTIVVLKDGKPHANATLNLEQVNHKEGQQVQTDQEGKLILPKTMKGAYLVELPIPTKVENGLHHDKPYATHYLNFTYLLQL
ncbi:DUF4198 domain-containing protein [Taibaiella sp. KBW10]|uniref:DUF4198 domain-containing protein n=1 Tax=Taibaiella sp. KBW10 TaxID=2153357 RepID=UPI0013155907|nr:DUF4198 domain-containing protein [Taibaiella sp. KBW10]